MSGAFAGLRVAFTGRLDRIPRRRAEALVRAGGGLPVGHVSRRTDLLVVGMRGWGVLPRGEVSAKLRRAEALRRAGHPIQILSERAFLARAGLGAADGVREGAIPFERAARLTGLPETLLSRCVALGIVGDEGGGLDFTDLAGLRGIAALLRAGADPAEIACALARLAHLMPELERPLAQLRLLRRDGRLVAALEGARLTPWGQLLLPLEGAGDEPGDVDALLAEGVAAEERGDWLGAERSYRAALAADPDCGEAWYNLASAHMARGRLREAERCLREAVRRLPGLASAWYNLGYVLDELGRPGAALRALRRAVRLAPGHTEAHFNLAVVAERLGRTGEALTHWRACLELSGDREVRAIARQRIRALQGAGRERSRAGS